MASHRFFRTDEATYEAVRLQLDAAWGYSPGTGTATCIEPAATAPRDAANRVVLAAQAEFCAFDAVSATLPELLQSGAVEEIDEATYRAAIFRPQL